MHEVTPSRRTLHGHFSAELDPVLTIDSGDTVRFETLDAGWNLEPCRSQVHDEHPRRFEPREPGRDDGHALCGPVAVRGARTGMTLAVRIGRLRVGDAPRLTMPRAETPAGTITFGLHEDLDEAAHLAVDGMLALMGKRYGLSRPEALALASVVVDLRVTQFCNGVRGVHAILPAGAVTPP